MKMASWNVARSLSSESKASQIVNGLDQIDADVVIVSEAYDQSGELIDDSIFTSLGYESLSTEYQDAEPHPSKKQYILALSRIGAQASVLRLGTRNALRLTVEEQGEEFSITGAHFDDRREDIRTQMASSF